MVHEISEVSTLQRRNLVMPLPLPGRRFPYWMSYKPKIYNLISFFGLRWEMLTVPLIFLRRLLHCFFLFCKLSLSFFLPKSLKLDTVKVLVENVGGFAGKWQHALWALLQDPWTPGWYFRSLEGYLMKLPQETNLNPFKAMKKGLPWFFLVYRGWNTTQVIIIHHENHEIRIPIKQPVFHGSRIRPFFFFVAHFSLYKTKGVRFENFEIFAQKSQEQHPFPWHFLGFFSGATEVTLRPLCSVLCCINDGLWAGLLLGTGGERGTGTPGQRWKTAKLESMSEVLNSTKHKLEIWWWLMIYIERVHYKNNTTDISSFCGACFWSY